MSSASSPRGMLMPSEGEAYHGTQTNCRVLGGVRFLMSEVPLYG